MKSAFGHGIDAFNYEGVNLGSGYGRDVRWDDEVSGLGVHIFPAGRKALVLSYRSRGRKRLLTLGENGSLSPRRPSPLPDEDEIAAVMASLAHIGVEGSRQHDVPLVHAQRDIMHQRIIKIVAVPRQGRPCVLRLTRFSMLSEGP